jgi:hypothetical protein
MGGCHEPTVVEVRKRHHVAIRQHREVMAVGHYPLVHNGLRTKKIVIDKALHACVAAI